VEEIVGGGSNGCGGEGVPGADEGDVKRVVAGRESAGVCAAAHHSADLHRRRSHALPRLRSPPPSTASCRRGDYCEFSLLASFSFFSILISFLFVFGRRAK